MSAVMRWPFFRAASTSVDHAVHLRPVRLAGRLQVINLGGQSGLAADADQLVDRFDEAIALAAHVRDVHALVVGRRLRDLDQLLGRRVEARRVDQRRRDAERAVLHLPLHQIAHRLQLLRRGPLVVEADGVFAQRRRADERGEVRRDAALLEIEHAVVQRRPGDRILRRRPDWPTRRARIASVSGPIESPSPKISVVTPCLMSLIDRPSTRSVSSLRHHVHEARARRRARRPERSSSRVGVVQIADRRDRVADDTDVGADTGTAGAVVDRAAGNDDVE